MNQENPILGSNEEDGISNQPKEQGESGLSVIQTYEQTLQEIKEKGPEHLLKHVEEINKRLHRLNSEQQSAEEIDSAQATVDLCERLDNDLRHLPNFVVVLRDLRHARGMLRLAILHVQQNKE